MVIISGGKLLGQGTYGCVFYPSIKCSSNSNENLNKGVSKVFKHEKYMNEELAEIKKIRQMDKKGKFTNRALGSCSTSSSAIDTADMRDCRFSRKITIPRKKLHQIVYEHKGIDLKEFMSAPYGISETFNYIYNLLKGVRVLIENRYLHLDLKPENILITDTNKALLIDFGLGRSFDKLYDLDESDYILSYDYPWYAPEFRLFYALTREDNVEQFSLKMMVNDLLKNYNDTELFDKQTLKRAIKSLLSILDDNQEEVRNNSNSNNGFKRYFEENFAHKADVFAIGMVMHTLLKHSDDDLNDFELEEKFKDIIFKAAHPNPFERYEIDDLIDDFEESLMPFKTNNPSVVSVKNSASVIVSSNSNFSKNLDCMKNKLPILRRMVDKHGLPKKFKTLKKQELCNKLKHLINDDLSSSVVVDNSLEECMKNKKPILVQMIDEKKLPKKYKTMKKEEICIKLLESNNKDVSSVRSSSNKTSYKTAANTNSDGVSMHDCMKFYTLKELKRVVDKKKLPLKLKQLNKAKLCESVFTLLDPKTAKVEVKRGPKKKRD